MGMVVPSGGRGCRRGHGRQWRLFNSAQKKYPSHSYSTSLPNTTHITHIAAQNTKLLFLLCSSVPLFLFSSVVQLKHRNLSRRESPDSTHRLLLSLIVHYLIFSSS